MLYKVHDIICYKICWHLYRANLTRRFVQSYSSFERTRDRLHAPPRTIHERVSSLRIRFVSSGAAGVDKILNSRPVLPVSSLLVSVAAQLKSTHPDGSWAATDERLAGGTCSRTASAMAAAKSDEGIPRAAARSLILSSTLNPFGDVLAVGVGLSVAVPTTASAPGGRLPSARFHHPPTSAFHCRRRQA